MITNVTVLYSYFCGQGDNCVHDRVGLSANNVVLRVGDKIAIMRDPRMPLFTRETRFMQTHGDGDDVLIWIKALCYPGLPVDEMFSDGMVFAAVKTGATHFDIVPRYSDWNDKAVLTVQVLS